VANETPLKVMHKAAWNTTDILSLNKDPHQSLIEIDYRTHEHMKHKTFSKKDGKVYLWGFKICA